MDAETLPTQTTPKRPALRFHGGKWLLAPWLIKHFPEHRTYVEPFGGAASVLLRKERANNEIYNDLDNELVNFFQILRERGSELREALELTPFARAEFNQACGSADDPLEQARRTAIRAWMGLHSNAIYRSTGFRSIGRSHGPSPATDWRNYPELLRAVIERLRGVVLENRDALELIKSHDSPDTLFYVDPPYVKSTRSDGGRGYYHEMTDTDHEQLAERLHGLRGTVIISGYPSKLYDRLYADWQRIDKQHRAESAAARMECLWISKQPPQRGLSL